MKKIILSLLIIAMTAAVLTGCAPSISSGLESKWHDYEKYTYDVIKDNVSAGTLTLESFRLRKEELSIGGKTYPDMTGTKVKYELQMNNDDKVAAEVFFTVNFLPKYSYKEIVKSGAKDVISAEYTPKKYKYTLTVDGAASPEEEITLGKATFYDNEMVYYVLRSSDFSTKNYSFSFNCPSPMEDRLQSRTAVVTSSESIVPDALNAAVHCYEVAMSANQEIKGSTYRLYYAKSPVTINETNVMSPLVKFIEGEYVYILKSIEVTEKFK